MNIVSIKNKLLEIPLIYKINIFLKRRLLTENIFINSLDHYIKINTIDHKTIFPASKNTYELPSYIGEEKIIDSFNLDPISLLKIKNGTLWGHSNIINITNKKAVYNHNTGENVNPTDDILTRRKGIAYLGKNRVHHKFKTTLSINKGISMVINYSYNYYHFMFECLPKFMLIEKCGLSKELPLIFDDVIEKTPQFMELVKNLNKENRPVITIAFNQKIHVKELYAFTPIHYLPANYIDINKFKPEHYVFNTSVIGYLRNNLMADVKIPKHKKYNNRKIFLSRKGTVLRQYNEDEIIENLISLGFEVVNTATMTIKDQIILFNSASVIVGASGAAFTNLLFCKPQTKVFILIRDKVRYPIFSPIASYLHLDLSYIDGIPSDLNNLHSSFHIDPDKLSIALKEIVV